MSVQAPERRSAIRLVGDRMFGRYITGKMAMSLGIWIHNIAAALLVYDLTGSAALVGAVSVLGFVPQLVVSPWAGTLSDRVDRRLQLMTGLAVAISAMALLSVWVLVTGTGTSGGAAPVFVASLLMGIGMAVVAPATHALIPGLVPLSDLDTAVALNSSTGNIARAVGPALGAALYAAVGPGWTFAVATGTFALFLANLAAMPYVDPPKGADSSLRAGLRFLRTQPAMIKLLLSGAVLGFGVDPMLTLTPPIAAMFGQGELFVGILASAFGCGAMLMLLVVSRPGVCLPKVVVAGFALLAAGLGGLGASPAPVPAVVAMAVAGAGFLLASTALMSLLQRQVPEEYRGRVMALWTVAYLGSRPVAAAFNGLLADFVSVRLALGASTVLVVAAAVASSRQAAEGGVSAAADGRRG